MVEKAHHQRVLRNALAVPTRRQLDRENTKLFGFPCFYMSGEDRRSQIRAHGKVEQREARQAMGREDALAREAVRQEQRRDYFDMVRNVNRYGCMPGHLFCKSTFPGREYQQHLEQQATRLVRWWKRRRSQRRRITR